jgi:hypothetical protein
MAEKLPSQAGRQVLLNLDGRRSAGYGLCYGGHSGTMASLRRNGLVDHQNQLTESGRKMVLRLTVTPEVSHVA